MHFSVEPVLRRRGARGEAHLAALTSPHAPHGYDYAVTFKADTLIRTSFAGVVRQLGHELEHVKQFEQGIRDFARQEFLAYGWMIFGERAGDDAHGVHGETGLGREQKTAHAEPASEHTEWVGDNSCEQPGQELAVRIGDTDVVRSRRRCAAGVSATADVRCTLTHDRAGRQ